MLSCNVLSMASAEKASSMQAKRLSQWKMSSPLRILDRCVLSIDHIIKLA